MLPNNSIATIPREYTYRAKELKTRKSLSGLELRQNTESYGSDEISFYNDISLLSNEMSLLLAVKRRLYSRG